MADVGIKTVSQIPEKKRGRNRSKAADASILQATLDVLGEKGFDNLTAGEVISRAGVSSATLYRRYGSLQELVTAALKTLGPSPIAIDKGSLTADLEEFIGYLGTTLSRNHHARDYSAADLRVDKNLRKAINETFVAPRKEVLNQILRRANSRGELDGVPPIDDCWSYISGPIHHRIFIRGQTFTTEFARSLTTMVDAGLRALAN